MTQFPKLVHRYFYLSTVIILFIVFLPLLYYYTLDHKKNYSKIHKIRRLISAKSLQIAGIRLEVNYQQPVDWSTNYIICPNHTSILDIAIISSLCKAPCSFMGKVELLKNPFTRIFFKTIDIPVDRSSKGSSFQAFKKASSLLKEKKTMIIFPEGKIDDTYPPLLHPFKKGAFKLAEINNVKILPVVIQNAWKLMWDDGAKYGSKPGIIKINVLSPIEINSTDSELETKVYNMMKESWILYNKV
ncbi:lysophospholipid acyltransferase family protein [Sphingobacterium sp. UT-1RO-CII-1]|uniref:lysophospholipid acyltransferase family protein n=1 Tax=Sphingobacterium sp. UT-1RO-CII-1 TaxID=2995225 RepID=UPI00227BDBCE|nr:lysophospholipid acyltransferase family protein [Sphingobacterium sp. UT-1RO-CII-1]